MKSMRFAQQLIALVLVLASISLNAPAWSQSRFDFDTTPGRLSKMVRPSHYAITLHLDPESEQFSGEVEIEVAVRAPISELVLHAYQLTAKAASIQLIGAGSAVSKPIDLRVEANEKAQMWRLVPIGTPTIARGSYRLQIRYTGRVNQNDAGLYQAPHVVDGQPARMLATQLEAVFARMLFPGFDEPAFRSVFDIAVRAPKAYTVVANTPLQSAAPAPDSADHIVHRFEPTPAMPTYLVAVAVGKFDVLEGRSGRVKLRILTAPGKRELGAYALSATQKILPFYNEYFGVDYVLPKLDQFAVPSTRDGAMEDWGLISYNEAALLFDPLKSSPQGQRGVFSIVAHEIAHQWFGNLVTAASWEEIWLNEAFATWLAEKATDRFNPEWQVGLRRRSPIDRTMLDDSGSATRAIRSGAVSEDHVFDVFDDITYIKGGAVLSMLEGWIGPEAFQRGLAAYMKERRFSNATAGDLWFHMGQAAGRDINVVASSWTDQKGFPLVSVVARCEQGTQTRLDFTQQRFIQDRSAAPDTSLWKVPLVLLHDGQTRTLLLESAQQSITLPGCPARPTILNPLGQGFYRVAYAAPEQAALARVFTELPAAARITILSDTFALAVAGRLPMSAFFDLLPAIRQVQGSDRPALMAVAREGLRFLDEALVGSVQQGRLRSLALDFLRPELAVLGWTGSDNEPSEIQIFRSSLIQDLARYGDQTTLDYARRLFEQEQTGRSSIPGKLRGAVYLAAGWGADGAQFSQLVDRLRASQREEDRWLLAEAAAAVSDPVLAEHFLRLSLAGGLPNNIAAQLPAMVAAHGRHPELAYRFTVDHYPALAAIAGDMFGASASLLPGAAKAFNDQSKGVRLVADQQRLNGESGKIPAAKAAARIALKAAVLLQNN
jgi:aminopeptidase N